VKASKISLFAFHNSLLNLHTTVRLLRDGKVFNSFTEPEDLPGLQTIIQSFRVKGMECKSPRAFIFLFNFPEAVTKKFFKNEKENFYCGCYCHQQRSAGTK
jgi:hypothetical protein